MNIAIQKCSFDGFSSSLATARNNLFSYACSVDMYSKGKLAREVPLALRGIIKNSKEKSITLKNDVASDLGVKVDISTLGQVAREVIEQRLFMQEDPNKFVPVKVGTSPFYDTLTTFKSFNLASDPEDGLIASNMTDGQFKSVDVGYDTVSIKRAFWAKQINWNFLQNMQASVAGTFDLLQDKLNILSANNQQFQQNSMMYGIRSISAPGLFNNSSVLANTTLITKQLKTMTAAEINTFVSTVIAAYQANNAIYEMPDTFVIPQSDYTGLIGFVSTDFPIAGNTQLNFLIDAFRTVTGNPNFKVIGTPYGQKSFSAFGYNPLSYDRYILYQNKEDSLYFDMPVPFTLLGTGTQNNSSFVQIGYCQIGQVFNKRTQNMLYMDNTAS